MGGPERGWFLFAAPALALIAAVFLLPQLLNTWLAFTSWSSFKDSIDFTGFANLEGMMKLGTFANP